VLTLLLIEPTPVLRQSLRNWLEVALPSCAMLEADNLARALTLASALTPRAILLDLDSLSEVNLGDIRRLAQLCPQTAILGMGLDDTPSHRQRAELAGVTIFVTKAQLQTDLLRVLQEINSDDEVIL